MTPTTSVWIEFAADDTSRALTTEISRLATAFRGPQFVSHLTLRGGLEQPLSHVAPAVGAVGAGTVAFAVRLVALESRPVWNQSLIFRAEAPELTELRAGLDAELQLLPEPFDPHVSLVYGPPARLGHQPTSVTTLEPPLTVRAAGLSVWTTTGEDDRDVPNWQRLTFVPFDNEH